MTMEEAEEYAAQLDLYLYLGYDISRACPHCNTYLKITDRGNRICLNACDMPTWMHRTMVSGLMEAEARVKARERANG